MKTHWFPLIRPSKGGVGGSPAIEKTELFDPWGVFLEDGVLPPQLVRRLEVSLAQTPPWQKMEFGIPRALNEMVVVVSWWWLVIPEFTNMTLLENPHFQQEIHLQMENFPLNMLVFVGVSDSDSGNVMHLPTGDWGAWWWRGFLLDLVAWSCVGICCKICEWVG